MSGSKEWLAMIYRLSSLPSRNRVYVWRKLKEAGAVFYQQGVAVLPDIPQFSEFMNELRKKIIDFGGEAVVIQLDFNEKEDEKRAVEQFNFKLQNDYSKIEKLYYKILDDLESFRKSEKLNISFLEERFNKLRKLKKSYDKITSRDYFKIRLQRNLCSIDAAMEQIQRYLAECKRKSQTAS